MSCVYGSDQVPEYVYPKDHVPDYSSILVPNVDNVRTDFLMQTIMNQRKAVLLIGEQGTAKTVMIKVRVRSAVHQHRLAQATACSLLSGSPCRATLESSTQSSTSVRR